MSFPGMPGMAGMNSGAAMDEEAMKQQMIVKYVRPNNPPVLSNPRRTDNRDHTDAIRHGIMPR
jgi:hypothetical protein